MKCKKCFTKNINSANYCNNCGNKFTEQDRKKAKKWTPVWFLEGYDKIMSYIDLSFLEDHIKSKALKVLYKISSILIVLAIGIYLLISRGINVKILEGEDYKVQYNSELEEYYLLSDKEETKLNLYIPNRAKEITVQLLDKENKIVEENNYDTNASIILDKNENGNYYIFEIKYGNNNLDKLKIYIYLNKTEEV